MRLDDFGPTGLSLVDNVAEHAFDGSTFVQRIREEQTWPGFIANRTAEGGAVFVDNFTVVPEPGALVLLALAATSGRARRRC